MAMKCPGCGRQAVWARTRCPACRARFITWYIVAAVIIAGVFLGGLFIIDKIG
jgi:uncharacterized OB-fold protein